MKKIISILGAIYSINAFAYYTETIPNECGAVSELFALFIPNKYTCAPGEFLPAHSLGCESCPDDYTCNGGTYGFNDNAYQGAEKSSAYITHDLTNMCAANAPHAMVALFTPNEHTCSAGYYMPANTDGCVICPANSYCSGGTYTFNETVAQGVQSCAAGLYAPSGMWESAQCGHILHIGNDIVYLHSVKKTTPSLNAKIGNDIFYGNMTTADVVMNSGTTHKLQVRYNDTVYSVYDDTVTVPIE